MREGLRSIGRPSILLPPGPDFPELLSGALSGGTDGGEAWFADFKSGNMKYIVFNGLVLRYEIGNLPDKERVCRECEKRGVAKEQMNWPE